MKRRNRRQQPVTTQPMSKPDFRGWRLETHGHIDAVKAIVAAVPSEEYEACLTHVSSMAVAAYVRTGVPDFHLTAYGTEIIAHVLAPNFIDRVLSVELALPH
jgi:hypothetical protein